MGEVRGLHEWEFLKAEEKKRPECQYIQPGHPAVELYRIRIHLERTINRRGATPWYDMSLSRCMRLDEGNACEEMSTANGHAVKQLR